jgi:maltose alpha-D-glucosyltransferase/alpha-amylase
MSSVTLPLDLPATAAALADDHLWYKDAVIYQVHVKAFFDSTGDGIGDFPGLTSRLDYIQSLGVNAVWLLPFYPSPMRDDGYDIADYRNVHADYGTRRDFRAFVREAHRRGIRVITELVINHTSDQHPWFQAARRSAPGSPKRNYYVWSDTDRRFPETRVIFTDTETSNWAWDPVAGAYYWHRFFTHQPDLNHNNPSVVRAVIRVMRFWLDMGVDGLRLDAIPYLCVREGTNNENLPETHAVVKTMRAVVDAHYRDRMFLAEANQWPEDVREYFGDGDECHMAYHFPLMPRMYMAVAQEDRYPMTEILAQTPEIPATCQWALFLRNHDELTLEMVTDRERDYMYRMYAADPRMRVNVGIRRRLAPLMDNDPDRIKLLNSLLLSLPGSPIIYYGDEIGMGDNVYLGDRNGMRTPMQWSPDRNAGFSRADPQRLYLPPIMDPIYGYQAVNVEAQSREPSSLLNWMKRLIAVRKGHRAFGRGTFTMLHPGNRKIIAYVREYDDEVILCTANLARSAQPVELDLGRFRGCVPVELLGGTAFPPIGELPYLLTLPGHAFYWFRLAPQAQAPSWHQQRVASGELPVLVLTDGLASFFPERVAPRRSVLADTLRRQLERDALPRFLAGQRWFAGRDAGIEVVEIKALTEWSTPAGAWLLILVDVVLRERPSETYLLPVALAWDHQGDESSRPPALSILARVRERARTGILCDAFADDTFCRSVVSAIGAGQQVRVGESTLDFSRTSAFAGLVAALPPEPVIRRLAEVRDSAVVIGERLILRGSRRISPGVNPALEMGRFLTEQAPEVRAVPTAGSVEIRGGEATFAVLASLQGYVENQGDAWSYTEGYLDRFLAQSLAAAPSERRPGEPLHTGYCMLMATLGRRAAELHRALAATHGVPAFQPEAVAPDEPAAWAKAASNQIDAIAQLLGEVPNALSPAERAAAGAFLDRAGRLAACLSTWGRPVNAVKTRIHGDLHLGQVLVVGSDVVVIGFGFEPTGASEARRAKHSPLRDLASLLYSLDRAALSAGLKVTAERPEELPVLAPLVRAWQVDAQAALLAAYRDGIRGCPAWPSAPGEAERLLKLFVVDSALREVRNHTVSHIGQVAASLERLVVLIDELSGGEPWSAVGAQTIDPTELGSP